jgi:hypothetical protein
MSYGRLLRLLALAAAGGLAYGIWLWNTTGFSLSSWLYVHFGVQGSGPYYGFWSGAGSDISELAVAGAIITTTVALWRRYNCHADKCWRIGLHHVAGGTYLVCRRHHLEITGQPGRGSKLTIEHLREEHQRHLADRRLC